MPNRVLCETAFRVAARFIRVCHDYSRTSRRATGNVGRHVQSRLVPAYDDLPEVLLQSGMVLAVAQEV